MVDCKLALLETSFSPDKIRMVIELIPPGNTKFDLPLEDAGKKLSSVANYARTTFEVKAAPVGPEKYSPEGESGPSEKDEARAARSAKLLDAGNKRVLATFESELAEAKKSGDKELIEKAKANLQRVKDRIARQKEEAEPST